MATRRIIGESDGHKWTDDWADIDVLKGRIVCVRCGFFKRTNGNNKPCIGDVLVGPRAVPKTCTICKAEKLDTEFPFCGGGRRHSWCKACKRVHDRAKDAEARARARVVREAFYAAQQTRAK